MRILGTAAALAVLAATLAPAPAYAAAWRHDDAAGDVRRLGVDDSAEGRPAPSSTAADLTRLRVVHGAQRVVVTLGVSDLQPGPKGVFVEYLTHEPGRFKVELIRLDDYETLRLTHAGEPVECSGLRERRDTRADSVRISVPRSCLGDPDTVRVGAGMFTQAAQGTRADDALLDDAVRARLKLGPEVAAAG
jgi:hypothetical protein